jgi:hypothetical protein
MNEEPSTPFQLPIHDPNIILDGCQILLKSMIEKIIERQINSTRATQTGNIVTVNVTKIEIEFET